MIWECEIAEKRWAKTLYNHPLSIGVDYFVSSMKGHKSSRSDKNAVGFLKRNLKAIVGENEQSIIKGEITTR